jgi:tripartite-type tricarboxylate transporter receptor subunit TctC
MKKGCLLAMVAVILGCVVIQTAEGAEQKGAPYPTRPIELVVPFPPGGMTDIAARALASTMHEFLGQPVVVSNKSGAAGMEAGLYVAREKPDGYAIMLGSPPFYLPEQHRDGPPYKSTELRAIASAIAACPTAIVSAKSQWKTMTEFLEWARTQASVPIGHTGKGTPTHQTAAALGKVGGFKVVDVPFAGDAPAAVAVLGNNIPIAVASFPALVSHFQAGTLRGLAVMSDMRMEKAKDVPTMVEAGFSLPIPFPAIGFFTSAGVSDEIVEKLDSAVKKSLEHKTTMAILDKSDVMIYYRDHKEFSKYIADNRENLGRMMKELGIIK